MEKTLEEEELGEEVQVDFINVMSKVTWLDTVLIQVGHGALIAEPMGTELKTTQG
jgi:hypothetical protein